MSGPEKILRYAFENASETYKETISNSTYDKVFTGCVGSILATSGCLGILFNLLALLFFHRRFADFKFKIVFKAAACIDLPICTLVTFAAISFLGGRRALAFSSELFCQIWGYSWSFVSKSSANIVAIASLMRVVNIYKPTMVTVVRMRKILIIDAAVLLIIELLPFLYNERYTFIGIMGTCVPAFAPDNIIGVTLRSFLISYIPGLLYFLPIPISLFSYIFLLIKLFNQRRQAIARYGAERAFQIRAMMTVTSFMAVYLLFQAPLALYIFSIVVRIWNGSGMFAAFSSDPWWFSLNMPSVVYVISVALNAVLNPLIYYWRLLEFRFFVRNGVLCGSRDDGRQTRVLEIVNRRYYRPLNWENVVDGNNIGSTEISHDPVNINPTVYHETTIP
jgi:hypothetical protein